MRERWGLRGTERPLDSGRIRDLNKLLTRKKHPANGPAVDESALLITDDDVPF
jgi:hypothetical protein